MDTILDLLWLRIPPINYVTPPLCEFIFSGSGSGSFVIATHPSPCKITGVRIEGNTLFWDALTADSCSAGVGAICYNVYHATLGSNSYSVVAECIPGTEYDVTGQTGCFRVTGITTEGECDLSDPACIEGPPPEEFFSEVWRNQNDAGFVILDTVSGETESTPELLLNINSVPSDIRLNWDSLTYVDATAGMAAGDIWCYKVRSSVPSVGNFSNEACAVMDQFFPFNTGTVVNHPTWQIAFGDFQPADNVDVTDINLSGLRAVIGGNLFLDALLVINTLDLSSLILVTGSLFFSSEGLIGGTLTVLSLPSLVNVNGNLFCDNTMFTSVSIPNLIMHNGGTYAFDFNALDIPSVEGILARGIASGVTSATIFLDGGTNAGLSSLSAQGQADYATLIGLGNTVSINP